MPGILSPAAFQFFREELTGKAASAAGGAKRLIKTRDLAAAALGATGLYGGGRLLKDVQAGERLRKAQKEQARGY